MSTDPSEFAALARRYTDLVDRSGQMTAAGFLGSCARLLPHIYAAGVDLPRAEPSGDDLVACVRPPLEQLRRVLGEFDTYFEVFDPLDDEPAIEASLADDLSDIHVELAGPLRAFDLGRVNDAAWEWRLGMIGHCGDHLVDAMRSIHRAVFQRMPTDDLAGDRRSA